MISENLRGFLRAAAWLLIVVGVTLTIMNGLRQIGLMSPPVVVVNGNGLYAAFSLVGSVLAYVVQGGVLLALLSLDERIQKRGQP